jgi:hypothetical protein
MGGEHEAVFHCSNGPCIFIHSKNSSNKIKQTKEDLIIWKKLKKEILLFVEFFGKKGSKEFITYLKSRIEYINEPKDIYLSWHQSDDATIDGKLCHDIVKLLILAFPGKICSYFDRCHISDEFNNSELYGLIESETCSMEYVKCSRIPKFSIYKLNDIDENYEKVIIDNKIQLSFNKEIDQSNYLLKLITPDYEFNLQYLIDNKIKIPAKIKILMNIFPNDIVNVICSYIYIIYKKRIEIKN